MSEEEIRRRKTSDPEMDAINVLIQAFESLDENTIKRILEWAEDRYLRTPGLLLTDSTLAATLAHFEKIEEYAKRHGVTSREVMHSISAARARAHLAPGDEGGGLEVNDPLSIANPRPA